MSRTFTAKELALYDGSNAEGTLYLALDGVIYDVTAAMDMYGPPSGRYAALAGADATLALATMDLSCAKKGITREKVQLDNKQTSMLKNWTSRFSAKYPVMGQLTDGKPEQTTSPTAEEPEEAAQPAVCPLGFGRRSGAESGGNEGVARCPLGFGDDDRRKRPNIAALGSAPRMLLSVLARHNGRSGAGSLVSVKAVVFDVSDDARNFGEGAPLHSLCGHDASRFLALGQGRAQRSNSDGGVGGGGGGDNAAIPLDAGLKGLMFDSQRRLEAWFLSFWEAFPAVALLEESDQIAVFGTVLTASAQPANAAAAAYGGGSSSSGGGGVVGDVDIHAVLEAGDVDALRRIITAADATAAAVSDASKAAAGDAAGSSNDDAATAAAQTTAVEQTAMVGVLVNRPCPRTGMSPLHKAVEMGDPELLRILLKAGADRGARARLYDGDTPAMLARRLKRQELADMLDCAGGAGGWAAD